MKLPIIFTKALTNNLPSTLPRHKLKIIQPQNKKSEFNRIIFIVDESVRGDLMSLNGFHLNSTPFLYSYKDNLYNYGIASSSTTCSSYSNLILQSGLRRSNIPDYQKTALMIPSIFQYAQKKGYTTYYIDSHSPKKTHYQNYMTAHDFKYINNKPRVKHRDDFSIISALEKILNKRNQKQFVYIIKTGAHFPYKNGYPNKARHFKPDRSGLLKLKYNKEERLNAYLNKLRWNTDFFFRKLIHKLKNKNILIIYTSDHGLDLKKAANHCSFHNKDPEQAMVPLFIIPLGKTKSHLDQMIQKYFSYNFNRTSHFNLFPTLLTLMGYPNDFVKKNYGTSLMNRIKVKRIFFNGSIFSCKSKSKGTSCNNKIAFDQEQDN